MKTKVSLTPKELNSQTPVDEIKSLLANQDELLRKICGVSELTQSNTHQQMDQCYNDFFRGIFFIKEWIAAHHTKFNKHTFREIKDLVAKQTEQIDQYQQFLERSLTRVIH